MKFTITIIIFLFALTLSKVSLADAERDCSQYSTKTIVGTWDKLRCEKGKPPRKKLELGKKIKNLNPFKKKN